MKNSQEKTKLKKILWIVKSHIDNNHKIIKLIITAIIIIQTSMIYSFISNHIDTLSKNTDIATYTNTITGVISSSATSIICAFTIISLYLVNKSNNDNKKDNDLRDKKIHLKNNFRSYYKSTITIWKN